MMGFLKGKRATHIAETYMDEDVKNLRGHTSGLGGFRSRRWGERQPAATIGAYRLGTGGRGIWRVQLVQALAGRMVSP